MDSARRTEWFFLAKWVLANIVGWAVAVRVCLAVGESAGGGDTASLVILVFIGPVIGAIVGTMQWVVLRRLVSWSGCWMLASLVVCSVGWVAGLRYSLSWKEPFVLGAVIGALIGIMQWLVLRPQVSQAGWWVLASIVGWGSFEVVFAARSVVGVATRGAIVGAVFGISTGTALVWLLQYPITEA